MPEPSVATEVDCVECGRHIVQIITMHPDELRMCALCICLPAWFEDAESCRIFDPENSRRPPQLVGDVAP